MTDAYWCGFLYADGCLSKHEDRWVLGVQLAAADAAHVQLFLDTYSSGRRVRYSRVSAIPGGRTYPTTSARFTSRLEPTHLERWGIVRRKTWNWVPPMIPRSLVPSYLRGWFDGDGGWTSSRRQARVTNARREPLAWFLGQLQSIGFTGRHHIATKNSGHHWYLSLEGLPLYQALNGDPCLSRKWLAPPPASSPNALKTHCKWGHELIETNVYRQSGRNSRSCLTCRKLRSRSYRA